MRELIERAERIGELLKARGETIAVAESSAGGLISAALLAVPGASAFYRGGAVVYTRDARAALLGITQDQLAGVRPSTEDYATRLATAARSRPDADWGLGETGAAGPTGNSYGDAPGHSCAAVAGPVRRAATLETGAADRAANMHAFAAAALDLLLQALRSR